VRYRTAPGLSVTPGARVASSNTMMISTLELGVILLGLDKLAHIVL
jgi:hypothetical protein